MNYSSSHGFYKDYSYFCEQGFPNQLLLHLLIFLTDTADLTPEFVATHTLIYIHGDLCQGTSLNPFPTTFRIPPSTEQRHDHTEDSIIYSQFRLVLSATI